MAEVQEQYRTKVNKHGKAIKSTFENSIDWYLTDPQIKTCKSIPKDHMPKISRVNVPKSLLPKFSELIKNDIRYFLASGIDRNYEGTGIEVKLDNHFEAPNWAIKDCGCNQRHIVVIKDCKELFAELIDLELQWNELKKVLSHAENSFKTLKTLKQGLIGIEKLAPKAISELESSVSSGQLILATDVSRFAIAGRI